jgi:predicted nuclease with RNAse H fold
LTPNPKPRHPLTVVGIDLAGSPTRNTGICTLRGFRIIRCETVYSDEEIISHVKLANPDLIAIDAPLNLPPGRKTIEDRNGEHFRPCDRELLKRGIRFFPITLGPMRSLTTRGIAMRKRFVRQGYRVIEMYPGAAQDIWRIPRKQNSLTRLRKGLERLRLRGLDAKMNGDELDAVTGALVGRLFLRGKAEVLGNFKEGAIVVPMGGKNRQRRSRWH